MATPYQILAAIRPEDYSANPGDVKKAKKESFKAALKVAKPKADKEFKLVYDSSSETLEPVYFWIVDFMPKFFKKVDKITDNFTSSPGSEDFLRSMDRAKRMQDSAMNIYGTVNTVIKSIQNIIYDLKEFQIRLADYERSKSKDKSEAAAGIITLKQIWMDQVDIKKGRGSINMLAQDLNFVTLRDAFMQTKNAADVENLDLNDRIKRILQARIEEFLAWKDRTYQELKNRYEIEKTYLRTQVDAVKMYSKWAKPYLRAAEELAMTDQGKYKPDIVKAFNTMYLQLTLAGISPIDVKDEAESRAIPSSFAKIKVKRNYNLLVFIDFTFRGIPSRVGQNYAFGGRVEVAFRAYALNQEELDLFYYQLEDNDYEDTLKLVQGMTDESLGRLKAEIDSFLEKKEEKEDKKESEDVNPFMALLGLSGKKNKKVEKEGEEGKKARMKKLEKSISSDSYVERVLRKLAKRKAVENCYTIYDTYKKAHGMASPPGAGFNM